MKKLSEVPFDKIYVGMPVCCLSLYKSTKGQIIQQGIITCINKQNKIITIVFDCNGHEFHVSNEHRIGKLNNTYLDPTRM